MATQHSSAALLNKEIGVDARRILDTLNAKLKAGAPPEETEQAVADELLAFINRQIERTAAGLKRVVNP